MKHFTGYFCKSLRAMKSHVIVLFLMNFLSAFMYYFVEASVDGNLRRLEGAKWLDEGEAGLLISIQSNKTLAFSFLILLTLIAGFVHFLFYRQYCAFHQKEIGCYLSCGYPALGMAGCVFGLSVCLAAMAHVAGLCGGWAGSGILLEHYRDAYPSAEVKKGLDFFNCVTAFLIGAVLPAVSALAVITGMGRTDTADLLAGSGGKTEKHAGKFLGRLTKRMGFSVRLALRRPFQTGMSFLAVGLFAVLFIMSASLNLSSRYVLSTQLAGRTYAYDVTFPNVQTGTARPCGGDCYLSEQAILRPGGKTVGVTMMGIEKDFQFLSLSDRRGKSVMDIPENGIVVSQALAELYGIQQGEELTVTLGDKSIPYRVSGIAENGEHFTIYTTKSGLEESCGMPQEAFNGIYTDDISKLPDGAESILSMEEREEELNQNNVSNRMSAVICQILGCVIGCLLLYLTILLKLWDDTKNIFILDMLGCPPGQINRMFVSVYRPILNAAFILLVFPAAQICKMIHRSLSLKTNDYIPFQCNAVLILAFWALLNLLYTLVKYLFQMKIDRIQKVGETMKYLS